MRTVPVEKAVEMIPDGAVVMVGGFMGVGTPERQIDECIRQRERDLTIIANDTAIPGQGIGKLVDAGLISRTIASHIGFNPETQRQMFAKKIAIDPRPTKVIEPRGDAGCADVKGRVKLNQLLNTKTAGAISGTFWGTLIGLIFLMPLAGAAVGAASGAIAGALADVGINDNWMKETAAAIKPGTAALFILFRKASGEKGLERLKGDGGTVMKTSLDHTKEAALQAALAGVQAVTPAAAA
jgi:uncharacterized membrane protein